MKKLRAYYNIMKLRVNMGLKRKQLHNYPVMAIIEPTSFCNLRCPGCPTGLQLGLRPSSTMKVDLFKAAIDEIGDYVFSLDMFNWGEPLLHRETPEMIRYAKDKGIEIHISTNLSVKLSDDYIERLVLSGLDRLFVSLDGTTEETYSKYRVRGDHQLVRDNMQRIQAAKKRLGVQTPVIEWKYLVFRHNEHQVEEAASQFREWGADYVSMEGAIMPAAPYDEDFQPSSIPKYNMYHSDHHFQEDIAKHDRSGRPCSWLYGTLVMNPNGKVSPCCASAAEKTDFGDYSTKKGFFEVWNNSTFKRARALFSTSPGQPPAAAAREKSEAGSGLVQIESRQPKSSLKEDGVDLCAGMGAQLPDLLSEDELICHKCPIPYRQDDVYNFIDSETERLVESFWTERSLKKRAHILLAYLLMGAPHLGEQLRNTGNRALISFRYRVLAH